MHTSLTNSFQDAPPVKKKGRRPNMSALAANIKRRGTDATRASLSASRAYDPNDIDSFLDEASHRNLGPSQMGPVQPTPAPTAQTPQPWTGGGTKTFHPDTRLAAHRLGFDLSDPVQSTQFFKLKERTAMAPRPSPYSASPLVNQDENNRAYRSVGFQPGVIAE